ncbi:succinate dehydrogenase assembly factor 2 [Paracoccus bogoriensis]|uniref:FAD assembly factor SdhE n=1 Tax=Paracoccus bogoriensis TaxID=242065 RepID=UPI001FEA09DD|nr:succinate dehydrogenase assembly factor 2 [Paracoccus bogoriensis]
MDKTTSESPEHRLKRLHMRSWRRGTKEMDLILGHFADDRLARLEAAELDLYERLLSENDQDLYSWITARIGARTATGSRPPDAAMEPMLDAIAAHAAARFAAG